MRQFRGLTGTAKAKAVCDRLPAIKHLRDFEADEAAVGTLLTAMQTAATPPKPGILGSIGAEHVRACFDRWYGVRPERFWYHKVVGEAGGVPFVVEAAVAETERSGAVFHGVNFSPTFDDPMTGQFLESENVATYGTANFLSDAHVLPWRERDDARVATMLHIVCPTLEFLDRGKTRMRPRPELVKAVAATLWRVAKPLYVEGERRKRDAAAAERRVHQERKRQSAERWTLKEAAFAVMEQAWLQATGNGAFEASARTVFYQARPLVQHYTLEELTDTYFTQTLLPLYQREVCPLPGVYYEARGTLYEPHTGREVALGTREVEDYAFPAWVYDKILFVEKQGLWPPLRTARLADRYDMAIIAGEGYATEAARLLLARADRGQTFNLFVLHDADPAGYNIARTLREETSRMPGYRVDVVDLGLRFEDGLNLGLVPETFTRKRALPKRLNLSERARQAFAGRPTRSSDGKPAWICERIELNALSSPELVTYIETGLDRVGATSKVVPDADGIRTEGERVARSTTVATLRNELAAILDLEAIADGWVPDAFAGDLNRLGPDIVASDLEAERTRSWRDTVELVVNDRVNRSRPDLRRLLTEAINRRS